jgi:hypothetical protein
MPENLTLNKIMWIIFIVFLTILLSFLFFVTVTDNTNFEILYVSIFVGIIVLKELTDEFTSNQIKKKFNVFISGLLIIFLLLIINELIYLIST